MNNSVIITANLITLNMLLGLWVCIWVLLYTLIKIVDLLD